MKIFKDQFGNKFKWKVRCFPIPLEEVLVDCSYCNGSGFTNNDDTGFGYSTPCNWCIDGKRKLQIRCQDTNLEKYLESCIDKYYTKEG